MDYLTGAFIVFAILLAISVFGYWRSSASSDRLDRDRPRTTTLPQDQGQYRP
jgi:hypothetical protein